MKIVFQNSNHIILKTESKLKNYALFFTQIIITLFSFLYLILTVLKGGCLYCPLTFVMGLTTISGPFLIYLLSRSFFRKIYISQEELLIYTVGFLTNKIRRHKIEKLVLKCKVNDFSKHKIATYILYFVVDKKEKYLINMFNHKEVLSSVNRNYLELGEELVNDIKFLNLPVEIRLLDYSS